MRLYYTEYPTGHFFACSDEEAGKVFLPKVIYRESDTPDGRPFIMIREDYHAPPQHSPH